MIHLGAELPLRIKLPSENVCVSSCCPLEVRQGGTGTLLNILFPVPVPPGADSGYRRPEQASTGQGFRKTLRSA